MYYSAEDPHGYIDYPFAEDNLKELGVKQIVPLKKLGTE